MTPTPTAADTEDLPRALLAAARSLGTAGGGAGAAQLLNLLYDPDVELARVIECLHGEPALAARVLKVANAPYYRASGSVGTVERAAQMLGLSAIRSIAAAGCLDRLAPRRLGRALVPEVFCRHSLAVACAAQQLARASKAADEGEAFMAGLLHDIGLLLLAGHDAAAVAAFEPSDDPDPAAALAAEVRHFGTTHEACAGLLVRAWALPEWLHDAVADHHQARLAGHAMPARGPLPGLLALADHAAHSAGFGLWPLCGAAPPPGVAAALRLDDAALGAVVDGLGETVARLSAPAAAAS